jgi:hypothetical protein
MGDSFCGVVERGGRRGSGEPEDRQRSMGVFVMIYHDAITIYRNRVADNPPDRTSCRAPSKTSASGTTFEEGVGWIGGRGGAGQAVASVPV